MKSFAEKMNSAMTNAMQGWWNSLSKEELLDYISSQEDITADIIRSMFSTLNISLNFDTEYSTAQSAAQVDFCIGDSEDENEE